MADLLRIVIKRIACDGKLPTLGAMLYGGYPFAVTLERPWRGNRRRVSCIPLGRYVCERVDSPKFGDTFEVMNVPGRKYILFHKGNIQDDTHGCIIVGEQYDYLNKKHAVLASRHGYNEFMTLLKDVDDFVLEVTDHYSER